MVYICIFVIYIYFFHKNDVMYYILFCNLHFPLVIYIYTAILMVSLNDSMRII